MKKKNYKKIDLKITNNKIPDNKMTNYQKIN